MSEHPSETRIYTAQPMSPTSSGSANADQVVSSCSPRGVTEDDQNHHHPWRDDSHANHHGLGTELEHPGQETMKDKLKDQRKDNSSNISWISFSDPVWSPPMPRRPIPTPSIQLDPRFEPENASLVEQGYEKKLASDNMWLPTLEEEPSYMDQINDKPGEIARGLLPVVEQEDSSFTDQDQEQPEKQLKLINRTDDCTSLSGNKDTSRPLFPNHVWTHRTPSTLTPSFELAQPGDLEDSPGVNDRTKEVTSRAERPGYEDQVHSILGEVARGVSGFEGRTNVNRLGCEGPEFKDQVQYRQGEQSMGALKVGKNVPNSLDHQATSGRNSGNGFQTRNHGLLRWLNPRASLREDIQQSTSEQDCVNQDEYNHQDPSLIYAVLVDGNTVIEAAHVTENTTRKTILWLVMFVALVTAGALTTLLLVLPKSPPGPMAGATAAQPGPTMGPMTAPPGPTPGVMTAQPGPKPGPIAAPPEPTTAPPGPTPGPMTAQPGPGPKPGPIAAPPEPTTAPPGPTPGPMTAQPGPGPKPGPIAAPPEPTTAQPGPTPGPMTAQPGPMTAPPNRTSFSCDLNFLPLCYFKNEDFREDFPALPCKLYAPQREGPLTTCMHRPLAATFLYNGGGCGQSDNLNFLNFTCNDFNGGPPVSEGGEAFIQVKGNGGSGPIVFERNVTVGDVFVVSGNDNYDGSIDFLDEDLQISIFTPEHNGSVLQEVNHVSLTCSSPLELLNRYGSVQVIEVFNAEQGLVSPITTYSTVVTLSIKIVMEVSDDESSITLTHMTAMTNFAGDLNLTEVVNGITVDHENHGIFALEGNADSSSEKFYTLIFEFDGVSNLDGSTCSGTDSTSLLFGLPQLDN